MQDSFEAQWAMLAEAYSILRERRTTYVSLDEFFKICEPLYRVIPPHEYQQQVKCAWKPWESEGTKYLLL